jgi:misacylated tRNA(Ala) deacylase
MTNQTTFVFHSDSYAQSHEAKVIAINELGGIVLDRTIFYATSGGQPGDSGIFTLPSGEKITIQGAIHPDGDKYSIAHLPAPDQQMPQVGDTLMCEVDWDRRFNLMRMHTALHLLSIVFPFPVTGGSIGDTKGRLDFNMPNVPENVGELSDTLNDFMKANHPVSEEWISEAELDRNPDMVKTMKVKPPRGQGRIRLIRIGTPSSAIDLQPCGGTHVRSTGEIGALRIGKIEKKGKENRRVSLHFDDGPV